MNASERDLGQFPLSIGTSLALEGAIGIHPNNPISEHKLSDFKELWCNVRTLFRNFHSAIGPKNYDIIPFEDIVSQFIMELDTIVQVVADKTNSKTKVVFYVSDYIGIDKGYHHCVLRVDSTELQVAYSKALSRVVSSVIAQQTQQDDKEFLATKIKVYQTKITDEVHGPTLILTNFAYDLTTKSIRNIFLIESHTGTIKGRNLFHTKFHDGKNLGHIPFREDMLTIFGDSELFRPIAINYRKALKEVAEKYDWSYATTTSRMRQGLDFMVDKYMGAKLKSFLHS